MGTENPHQGVEEEMELKRALLWREEDRIWRQEERQWREEDLEFREEERRWFEQEQIMRDLEKAWHEEELEQRHVDNARYIWARFSEKNRRDVEEKSEQLKAISNLSALFAGFAVVTLTQFNFDYQQSPLILIAMYGILTAISVCLMTIAMVLCTLVLGSILKNGKLYVSEEAEEEFMLRCRAFIRDFQLGDRPPAPKRTFERFWEVRCEKDWKLAFSLFTWGVFSFLVSLVPVGWIKFHYSHGTAYCFMAVIIISILVWAWKQFSWGSYLTNREEQSSPAESDSARGESVGFPWDWHILPGENAAAGRERNVSGVEFAPSSLSDSTDSLAFHQANPTVMNHRPPTPPIAE